MDKRTKNSLKTIAEKYNLLLLIYFGSRAKNQHHKQSDYDFAFYKKEKTNEKQYNQMKKEIYDIIKNPNIDLIDLNQQDDPLLRYEILKTGECIYEKEKGIFEEAQTNSWFNYLYYKPYLKEQEEFVENSLKNMAE